MTKIKIAIAVRPDLLDRLNEIVAQGAFPSRSQAIEDAIREKLERLDRSRLARECGKLDRAYEKSLAEEGMQGESEEWPEY